MVEVAPGVHRFTNGVSNFYVRKDPAGTILIDAGVTGDWRSFNRGLEALGLTLRDVRAIVLTHAHSDHTGFSEKVRSGTTSAVWVHTADAAVAKGAPPAKFETGLGGYLFHLEAWRTLFILLAHGGSRIVPVQLAAEYADGAVLDLPGRPRVVHLPGHTAGMSAIYLEQEQLLFSGDALITRNPLTGRRGPQIMPRGLNGSSDQALASLSAIEPLPTRLILPGHGEPWSGGSAEAVRKARAAGPS